MAINLSQLKSILVQQHRCCYCCYGSCHCCYCLLLWTLITGMRVSDTMDFGEKLIKYIDTTNEDIYILCVYMYIYINMYVHMQKFVFLYILYLHLCPQFSY